MEKISEEETPGTRDQIVKLKLFRHVTLFENELCYLNLIIFGRELLQETHDRISQIGETPPLITTGELDLPLEP